MARKYEDESGFETGEYWARRDREMEERIAADKAYAATPMGRLEAAPIAELVIDPLASARADLEYKRGRLAQLEAAGRTEDAERLRVKIAEVEAGIARKLAGEPPLWAQWSGLAGEN